MGDEPRHDRDSDPEADAGETPQPEALIVKNVPDELFEDGNESARGEFEALFKQFDDCLPPTFTYLKFFRRVRVQLSSGARAASAKAGLHESQFMGRLLKCYFMKAHPRRPSPTGSGTGADDDDDEDRRMYLLPPEPQNLFLLSPPASPPVGWQQYAEREPVVNYDLLAAVAQLAPGEAHELYAGTDTLPKIVVHIADEDDGGVGEANGWRPKHQAKLKIPQTKCPARNC